MVQREAKFSRPLSRRRNQRYKGLARAENRAAMKMVIRNWWSMDRKMAEIPKTKRIRMLLLVICEGVMMNGGHLEKGSLRMR